MAREWGERESDFVNDLQRRKQAPGYFQRDTAILSSGSREDEEVWPRTWTQLISSKLTIPIQSLVHHQPREESRSTRSGQHLPSPDPVSQW